MKSLIVGTKHEEELKNHHEHKNAFEGTCDKYQISRKCWMNFIKRHKDELKTMKGRRLDLSRDKWSKCRNFKMMCDLLHDEMENCGVAVKVMKNT